MALITVLRNNVATKNAPTYERVIQFIAERAQQDDATFKWTARASTGTEGRTISFVSGVENFVELAAREDSDVLIRRLFGESTGDSLIETLGEGTTSSYSVLQQREDLSSQILQPGAAPELVLLTRLRVTPGGALGCEELIRKVVEAASKVDDQRRYGVLQPIVGDIRTYVVGQAIEDPAQLDQQGSVPALLAEAYGEKEGAAIFTEGTACIETAETELSVLRPDLSNQ